MKRAASIFLIVIICLQVGGFYVYYSFRLSDIHREMRAQLRNLPADQLQQLVLSKKDYDAARVGGDEVRVDGRMYDIARLTVVGDSVHIYCLHDEAEDNLIAFMGEILHRVHTDDEPVNVSVILLFALKFVPSHFILTQPEPATDRLTTAYQFHSSTCFQSSSTPPPEC